MPLFTWSGHSVTQGSSQSAGAALSTALDGQTELVLMYMLNEVSTQDLQRKQAAFSHLQDALDQAQSSAFVALPVAKVDVDSVLTTAATRGAVGETVQSSARQAYLAAHPDIMTNSKPDVVVVRFPEGVDAASADAIIGATEKAVSAATSGKYDIILSTTSSMEPGVASNLAFQFSQASNAAGNPEYTFQGSSNQYRNAIAYGSSRFLTPTLMVAILITIYMGFLALAAYCCILSLQTPEKFEGDQEKEMQHALNPDQK